MKSEKCKSDKLYDESNDIVQSAKESRNIGCRAWSAIYLLLGKFLPSPGLQGHQADLVILTNKNKTCRMKVLASFE